VNECDELCRPRSSVWEAFVGLPSDVKVNRVTNAVEKETVMSLLSSSEISRDQSPFLFNKVSAHFTTIACGMRDGENLECECRRKCSAYLL